MKSLDQRCIVYTPLFNFNNNADYFPLIKGRDYFIISKSDDDHTNKSIIKEVSLSNHSSDAIEEELFHLKMNNMIQDGDKVLPFTFVELLDGNTIHAKTIPQERHIKIKTSFLLTTF